MIDSIVENVANHVAGMIDGSKVIEIPPFQGILGEHVWIGPRDVVSTTVAVRIRPLGRFKWEAVRLIGPAITIVVGTAGDILE